MGHQVHVSVVIIDLPEAADIALLDEAEVVLAVRVVVLVELVKRPDFREDQATTVSSQRFKACRDDNYAADEGSAKRVVEFLDTGGGIWLDMWLSRGLGERRGPLIVPWFRRGGRAQALAPKGSVWWRRKSGLEEVRRRGVA